MKKLFLSMVVAMFALCANAQYYVGGGIGFGVQDNGDDDVMVYKFMPNVGYTFSKDFSAGIAFGWQGASEGSRKQVLINPYVRYTFASFNAVSVFVDGTVGYTHQYNGYRESSDSFQVGVKPGVAVSLNDKLSFVAHVGFLGYESEKYDQSKDKSSYFGFDLDGSNLTFGLYYNF